MNQYETCPECGVPRSISLLYKWLDNGDFVQAANEGARMAFVECGNLDPIFSTIGEMIGVPLDQIIINIVARGTQLFMDRLIPDELKEMIRNKTVDFEAFTQSIIDLCFLNGYGRYEFAGFRYEKDENDYARLRIYKPFSVLYACGAFAGVLSASVGGEHFVDHEEVSPGLYELTSRWTEYPDVLKERMKLKAYQPRPGGLELERCPSCGAPKLLSRYMWDAEMGTIHHRDTGYRMAFLGPGLLNTVFEALEWELGEEIPGAVVEAQRRISRGGFQPLDLSAGEEDLRQALAIRGLGNLKEFRMDRSGLSMTLGNSTFYLVLTGLVQGSFESLHGKDSGVSWELSEDQTLKVEVEARS